MHEWRRRLSCTGGHTATYGVWIAIHPDELQRAFAAWQEPAYTELELQGYFANSVQPWGALFAPVDLAVRDTNHTPHCIASTDETLSTVINDEWDHNLVLSAIPK